MHRKIKFRVWDNLKREWVSNTNIWRLRTDPRGIGEIHPNAFYWKQHPQGLTIQQFTGIKDSKGVDIYEGDILSVPGWRGIIGQAVVKYEEYEASDDAGVNTIGFRRFNEYGEPTVLGNIFENADLLEK